MNRFVPTSPTPTGASSRVRLAAVGDVTLGDHPLCVGFGAYSRFRSEAPIYPFQRALAELQSADLLFGNLECALSDAEPGRADWATLQMRAHPKHAEGLAAAGFRVLNVANNHSMHHGRRPFLETIRLLEAHGITPCGVSSGNHLAGTLQILDVKGIRVGFLGYSLRPRQHFAYDPLYTEGGSGIERDVADARTLADIVVVSLHWGEEFVDRPSLSDVALAHSIIDAGAHVIIGHHPHVLRGIETYKHGIIVYSLGNFVGDMIWDGPLRESMIFTCNLAKSGVSEGGFTPVWINDSYQPEVLTGSGASALSRRIRDLSEAFADGSAMVAEPIGGGYELDVASALQRHRRRSYRHFVGNLHRYPSRVLVQHVSGFVRRRLASRPASA